MSRADWSKLTAWLADQVAPEVRIAWRDLDTIVGGLPASAIDHHPQWWHGDRPNTRAWRAAGYELDHVDLGSLVTFRRRSRAATHRPNASPSPSGLPRVRLPEADPRAAMIILQCSGDKAEGGVPPHEPSLPVWPPDLLAARKSVAPKAHMDAAAVMPAWQRYIGTFYKNCRPSLAAAAAGSANIVIVSGGYGVVTATEPVGWYDKRFTLADWPPSCLERALLYRAAQTHAESVIAFASATTDYAKLIRKTPWTTLSKPVYLVTGKVSGGGAMVKVPKALAYAFSAYWNRRPDGTPEDVAVERIA